MKKNDGKNQIKAVFGEIAEQDVDAIALPTTPSLRMDIGISAKVKESAGQEVEEEALQHAPAAMGNVVATGGGSLQAGIVFHCVMVTLEKETSEELLRGCLGEIFRQAEDRGIKSMAFPALGSTFQGLTPQTATDIIVQESKAAVDAGAPFIELVFTVCDRTIFSHFKRALKKHLK